MTNEEIRQIQKHIESLPKGTVTVKRINGKEYEYWQFRENGRQITRRVKGEELDTLRVQICERKRLEKLLKDHGAGKRAAEMPVSPADGGFQNLIRIGDDLLRFAEPVKPFKKREIYSQLEAYLYSPVNDRILILYGLRRTGKTTMIRQAVLSMPSAMQEKSAFIQVSPEQTLASLNHDLRLLENYGIRYVFIDEVTLLSDFIEGAALFSDIFAASGMKIVLSGTDSLGFLFSEDEQLYDRCILLHTTFIPYREFELVLGVKGIDEYIRYGGTMSLGGVHYNENSTFASKSSTDEYVDSAIARNIQHSLRYYQGGRHFRHLQDLYEHDELTSAINRIVEDINHRFTLEVLTGDFRSSDLELSRKNLRRDRKQPTDILDRIDFRKVTERLRNLLEIRNLPEQSVGLTDAHVSEIREYLDLLDLTHAAGVYAMPSAKKLRDRTIISQPGLRYAQADALVSSLLQDQAMSDMSLLERNYVLDRIRSEIMGRMMEDIVLLETALANPGKQVFVLQFAVGEFDMVVFDPAAASCEIYEIKHSAEIVTEQVRHLTDPEKCAMTEHRYGTITRKTVLYRGTTQDTDGIRYMNVEEYLKGIG